MSFVSSEERINRVKNSIRFLIPEIISGCCSELESDYKKCVLGDKIVKTLENHLMYVSDVIDLYKWMELPYLSITQGQYARLSFANFIQLYFIMDGGLTILDKLIHDLKLMIETDKGNIIEGEFYHG